MEYSPSITLDVPGVSIARSLLVVAHWRVSDEFDVAGHVMTEVSKTMVAMMPPLNSGSRCHHHDQPRSNCPTGDAHPEEVFPYIARGG